MNRSFARYEVPHTSDRYRQYAADDGGIKIVEHPSNRLACCVFVDEIETCGFASCANRLYFGRRGTSTETSTSPRRSIARAMKTTLDRYIQPTLRQAWPREYPRPQYAFKISMFNVSCNSHYFTQLAALFIDTRAE